LPRRRRRELCAIRGSDREGDRPLRGPGHLRGVDEAPAAVRELDDEPVEDVLAVVVEDLGDRPDLPLVRAVDGPRSSAV
jgi:hypothetical protein